MIALESYLSLGRNDIVIILEKWIYGHRNYFLQLNNEYKITFQFLMMYSYYADNFYHNLIQGISESYVENRQFHQDVLKFCCFLMKNNYDYENNNFRSKKSQILYI